MGKTKIKELEETIVTPAEEQVDSVILGIPSLSKETPESDSGQAPNRDGSGRASMTEEKKVKKSNSWPAAALKLRPKPSLSSVWKKSTPNL